MSSNSNCNFLQFLFLSGVYPKILLPLYPLSPDSGQDLC